jgi:3-oxoacyl-[acyl-carrier-protein] synthase III
MKEHGADAERAPYVARFASLGRSLPQTRLTTSELMASTRHKTHVDLERLTGIHERRVSTGEEDSFTLAVRAAQDCLSRWDGEPEQIDLVISCSITKYRDGLSNWFEPPMSVAVASAIGARNATPIDVSNACAGTLTGVFVANNWVRRGAARNALVVSGEYISQLGRNAARHVRTIASRELASLTLGDAGGALLMQRAENEEPGIAFAGFTTISEHSRLCLAYPARHDPGYRMFTKSRALHNAAIADLPSVLREVLDSTRLEIDDIDWIIPHQTSARAIRKGMAALGEVLGGTPREPAVVTVDRYGNTASTTQIVALVEELRAGRPSVGDRVALVALASGIELGVVVFTVDEALAEPLRSAGAEETADNDRWAGSPRAGTVASAATDEGPGHRGNDD